MSDKVTINYIELENDNSTRTETGDVIKSENDDNIVHIKDNSDTHSIRFSTENMNGKRLYKKDSKESKYRNDNQNIKILYYNFWESDYELHIILPNENVINSPIRSYLLDVNGTLSRMINIDRTSFIINYNNTDIQVYWNDKWIIDNKENILESDVQILNGNNSLTQVLCIQSENDFKRLNIESRDIEEE